MSRHAQPSRDLRNDFGGLPRQRALVVVDELRRRFVRFRRNHPRNARVPSELRVAVLTAIARGVTPGLVRRACGLSGHQLKRWGKGSAARVATPALAPTLSPALATEVRPARIFSVTTEATARSPKPAAQPLTDALELRLGPWSVCVRLATPPDATRG